MIGALSVNKFDTCYMQSKNNLFNSIYGYGDSVSVHTDHHLLWSCRFGIWEKKNQLQKTYSNINRPECEYRMPCIIIHFIYTNLIRYAKKNTNLRAELNSAARWKKNANELWQRSYALEPQSNFASLLIRALLLAFLISGDVEYSMSI